MSIGYALKSLTGNHVKQKVIFKLSFFIGFSAFIIVGFFWMRPISLKNSGQTTGLNFRLFWSPQSTQAWEKWTRSQIDFPSNLGLKVRFLGVTSVALTQGKRTLLMDGYFSRLSAGEALFQRNEPDRDALQGHLRRLGLENIDPVLVGHTHVDHYFDAPVVAKVTGASIVGGSSILSAIRLGGLPPERVVVVESGDSLEFDPFHVHVLDSNHSPGDLLPGVISDALSYPLRINHLKCGENLSYYVSLKNLGTSKGILFHPSAGFIPGRYQEFFRNRNDTLVFLAVGKLGNQPRRYCDEYWKEVVLATRANRVILTHWDDFFSKGMTMQSQLFFPIMRPAFDRVDLALECIYENSIRDRIPVEVRVNDQDFGI